MKAENKLFFVFISLSAFFLSVCLLPEALSVLIEVARTDPLAVSRPQVYSLESRFLLYVRHVSLTVSGGYVTSVTVTVYNSYTRAIRVLVHAEIYDDANTVIWYGDEETAIPPRRASTVSIPVYPHLLLGRVYRVRAWPTRPVGSPEPIEVGEEWLEYSTTRAVGVRT